MFMAFPTIILALAIVSVFGQSQQNVMVAIAIVQTPLMTRVVRSSALAIRQRAFVEAAVATGVPNSRIIVRHIVPNTMPFVLIVATAALGYSVLAEASLSFLGVGIPAPAPSLGSMLSGSARQYAEQAPWLVVFPGLVLAALVFGANFLGDGLRDALDPRMRGRR
jgi:peptide/nickel transport system permease protein